jgi:hypothetical protein
MHQNIVFSIALTFMIASPLSAQARDSLSLDATVGSSVGSGGRHHHNDDGGIGGELTLTVRPHPDRETAVIAALTVGGRRSVDFGDKCAVEPGAGSGCLPAFPAFSHVGILGGIERRASALAVRALAGPAFYGGGGVSGVGGQFQLDGAAGSTHLALVVAARGSVIASFTGETLLARSLEFGLRVR